MGWEYHDRERTRRGTWADQQKRYRISVRLSAIELELIRGRAYARQMSMSNYIMSLVNDDLRPRRAAEDTPPVSGNCTPTVNYPQEDAQKRPQEADLPVSGSCTPTVRGTRPRGCQGPHGGFACP